MATNLERLEAAGLILRTPLPEAYEEVVNDLSDEQMNVLLYVKGRLDEAGARVKELGRPDPDALPAFTTFMIF